MLDDKVKIIKAAAEKNRLRILRMLKEDTMCVGEIREVLKLANSTVSQHLKILRLAGFIEEEKDGKRINYKINPHPPNPVVTSIIGLLDIWLEDEDEIKMD